VLKIASLSNTRYFGAVSKGNLPHSCWISHADTAPKYLIFDRDAIFSTEVGTVKLWAEW